MLLALMQIRYCYVINQLKVLIALLKNNQILAKCEWESNNNESKTLLPNINHLIKKNNLNIQSCSKIFVVIGPGGFSSLRIGVSTAKGLSIILGIPLIPIPTLLSSAMEFITENNNNGCIIYSIGAG